MGKTIRSTTGATVSFLLALVLVLSGIAFAPSANAADNGDRTLKFKPGSVDTTSMEFKLYKVGTVVNDEFVLDSTYSESGAKLDFEKKKDSPEWAKSASTLYDYIKAKGLEGSSVQTKNPDGEGCMTFSLEKRTLYLVASDDKVVVGNTTHFAYPMYVWVIEGNTETISIKPGSETKNPKKYTLVKHWKNDSSSSRPESIKVEIYEDDKLIETVELSSDNDWTYSWKDEDGKGSWTCVEKSVPKGYSCQCDKADNGSKIILTNTKKKPSTPPSKIRTGDPTAMRWSVIAMAVSGLVLLIGAARRRKSGSEE